MNTNVRETAGQAVGTVDRGRLRAGLQRSDGTPYSGVPLSQLYIRQQSHDRNIYDITLDNQTELTAKFDTGPVGHTLLMGVELGYESYYNQNYYRGTAPATACPADAFGDERLRRLHAGRLHDRVGTARATSPQQYGNLATGQA